MCTYAWISDLTKVRLQVIFHALDSPWQCHPSEEEDDQHHVGECSSEVHYLQTHKCMQAGYGFVHMQTPYTTCHVSFVIYTIHTALNVWGFFCFVFIW